MSKEHIADFAQFRKDYALRGKRIDNLETAVEGIQRDIGEIKLSIKEMVDLFQALSVGKKLVLSFAVVIGSLVGIVGGLIQLSKWAKW